MTTRKRRRRENNIRYSQIPNEQDWTNPYDDADIRYAKKHFFGKTIEEAEKLFVENALYYQEDIMFMPSGAFRYYVHAYINYLQGKQSDHDTDGASCFLSIIKSKMESNMKCDRNDLRAVWLRVKETIEHIRSNSDWFDWNESIYGNLEERTTRLLSWDENATP